MTATFCWTLSESLGQQPCRLFSAGLSNPIWTKTKEFGCSKEYWNVLFLLSTLQICGRSGDVAIGRGLTVVRKHCYSWWLTFSQPDQTSTFCNSGVILSTCIWHVGLKPFRMRVVQYTQLESIRLWYLRFDKLEIDSWTLFNQIDMNRFHCCRFDMPKVDLRET